MLKQYTFQATRPGYSAALYRAYRAVGGGKIEKGTSEPVALDPFALVTARVEEELKSPLQNMLGGDLMQLLLIQTQVMKVDMESALLQMDQIMRANRLNFSLMAGLPTLLAVVSMVSLGSTSLGACVSFFIHVPLFTFSFPNLFQAHELIVSGPRTVKI